MKRLFVEWYNASDELSTFIPATTAIELSKTCIELYSVFGRSRTHIWKRYLSEAGYCCHKMLRTLSTMYLTKAHPLNYRLLTVSFTRPNYAMMSVRIRQLLDTGTLMIPVKHKLDKFDLDLSTSLRDGNKGAGDVRGATAVGATAVASRTGAVAPRATGGSCSTAWDRDRPKSSNNLVMMSAVDGGKVRGKPSTQRAQLNASRNTSKLLDGGPAVKSRKAKRQRVASAHVVGAKRPRVQAEAAKLSSAHRDDAWGLLAGTVAARPC